MTKRKAPSRLSAGLRLKLEGQVTLPRLGQALDAWTEFLREVGQDVAGAPKDALRYVVTAARGGSFAIEVEPQVARRTVSASVIPRIVKSVTAGIRILERSAKRPRHFTDRALVRLRDLALLKGPEIPAVKVSNGKGDAVALSARLVQHVEAVLAPEFESIGTVEGQLEGLIIHGKRRFLIFDHLTGRQVTCYFTGRVEWESVLSAFGKRVAASGVIKSRGSGERVSLAVSRLFVFPPDSELPRAEAIRGTLKVAR